MPQDLPAALLSQLSEFVAGTMGLYFPRERWHDLERGIRSAARESAAANVEAYAEWLLSTPLTKAQIAILASELTVGETYFFRETRSFEIPRRAHSAGIDPRPPGERTAAENLERGLLHRRGSVFNRDFAGSSPPCPASVACDNPGHGYQSTLPSKGGRGYLWRMVFSQSALVAEGAILQTRRRASVRNPSANQEDGHIRLSQPGGRRLSLAFQ